MPDAKTVTKITFKGPDYLSRLRTITTCIADSIGMCEREIDEAALMLTEACVNAIRHGTPDPSRDGVVVTLEAQDTTLTAEVADRGHSSAEGLARPGIGVRLMKAVADSVDFERRRDGLTVRLVKSAVGR